MLLGKRNAQPFSLYHGCRFCPQALASELEPGLEWAPAARAPERAWAAWGLERAFPFPHSQQ
ncbi:Protein of unknown function [Gryllus bimaculatus]|nr:Protein of unknown function [Gryllus bimaculatus]